ncbi:unnamed protein product [Bursaphelenchus xylophilus]|uniref:(pine wood nematode) hypothetical protein n=1 Tax=Bursaphelenchus xylophilus TaxID=6326 RepID=A0A1I7RHS1_BURXY|nr:unnamed protein product [Bursaphelenchus xylophilus]CAG9115449.1 unnamed protein product [Bursaphelenchus xylophilus]
MLSKTSSFEHEDKEYDGPKNGITELGKMAKAEASFVPAEVAARMPSNFKCPTICHLNEGYIFGDELGELMEEEPSPFWCQMYYYQFDYKLNSYRAYTNEIIIDGLCTPANSTRFSLGIKGCVGGNEVAEKARRQIGDGCRLTRRGPEVYLQCLTDSPLFLQCPLYAVSIGDDQATVYRLAQPQVIQIFNDTRFEELLDIYLKNNSTYKQLRDLQNMCHVRISFVKGWGSSYRRRTVTTTPCWVEMYMVHPLERLDECMRQCEEWNRNPVDEFANEADEGLDPLTFTEDGYDDKHGINGNPEENWDGKDKEVQKSHR